MKLFTTDDIHTIEQQTLSREAITTATLVERVGEGAASEIATRWRPSKRTIVFAGPGNNGADALATAIQLIDRGFNPSVYLFNIGGANIKPDCRRLRDRFRLDYPAADFHEITSTFNTPEISSTDLVIDGLFGSGLREPLSGGFMALVRYINESGATVVSIDIPSGMFSEWNYRSQARNTIHATLTLAVQFPCISFFFAENAPLIGQWKVLDIGLSHEAIEAHKSTFHLIEETEIKTLLKPRQPFCSKADFGSACLVAGRFGMAGAAILACSGALRSGAGKVTLFAPQCAYQIAQTSVPEAMFESDDHKLMLSDIRLDHPYTGIGIGPGIGTSETTVNAVEAFLKKSTKPLVIDADALNCIAARPQLLNHIPMLSVLTPHTGEFDRLFGEHTSAEARLIKALEVSRHYNLLILLKGHHTALVRPDGKVYFNSSGSPAMATPGAGDVLTGVLTSFIAQGYKPEVSAIIAAYIHGVAGQMAASVNGDYGVTAGDIAAHIGRAIMLIMQQPRQSFV